MSKKNLKVNITADASGLEKETKKASKAVSSFKGSVERSLKSVTAGFVSLGMAAQAVSSAIRTIVEFQSANSRLAAVLGTTTKGIQELTKSAIQLGQKTMYTASQVTDLQTELAKLGFSESEIQAMQEPVLKFAAAVGTDLASAAARAGATMRGFKLTAEETGDVLATMAVSTSKSALSFGYLDESLGKLVPVTKSMGLDVKATTALLGTLANAGIDAASATTALRNTIIELGNADSKLVREMGQQPKSMEELIQAFERLREKHIGVADAADLVGKRAAPAFLALLDGADSCRELYGELQNVNTELDRMYDTMTNNVEGSVGKLKSAWEGFTLSLRESQGPLKWIIDRLTDMVMLINLGISGFKSAKIDEKIEAKKREWQDAGMTPEEMQVEVDYRQNRIDMAKERGASKSEIKQLVEEMLIAFNAMSDLTKNQTTVTGGATGGAGGTGAGGSSTGGKGPKSHDWAAEAREYARGLAEIQAYDDEMSQVAAQMYEEFHKLHGEVDTTAQDIVDFGLQAVLAFEKAERANAEMVAEFQRQAEIMEQAGQQLVSIFEGFFVDTFANVGTFIGDALTTDFDTAAKNLGDNLLESLGSLAMQVGELAISVGVALLGIKESLKSLNPYVAIAAGAALVALGAAVKSAASNLSSGMGGYSSSRSLNSYSTTGGNDELESRNINIRVTGKLVGDGRSIVGTIQEVEKVTKHTT